MVIKRNDSCCKLDEPQKYSAKFKKPVTKDHMWCGFISVKCDWLCVLAGWSMLPVSVTSITPRGWWGRASACSWICSSAQPSNPTSQASPKSRGAPGSCPHRSPPRPLGSSPCLLPHLLPLHSTPGGGPGEAAGTLLFASLFLLSLFFLIDFFFREVLVSQQNEAKNTVISHIPHRCTTSPIIKILPPRGASVTRDEPTSTPRHYPEFMLGSLLVLYILWV